MYLVFAAIIGIIIVLFGSSIITLIKANVSNSTPSVKLGNLWFSILLIINITIIIFIYVFYYYKTSDAGKLGPTGKKGLNGEEGEPCMITMPNSIYYAPYTKIS
jgi:hypothetical protein